MFYSPDNNIYVIYYNTNLLWLRWWVPFLTYLHTSHKDFPFLENLHFFITLNSEIHMACIYWLVRWTSYFNMDKTILMHVLNTLKTTLNLIHIICIGLKCLCVFVPGSGINLKCLKIVTFFFFFPGVLSFPR